MLFDAVRGVGQLDIGGLDGVPNPPQPLLHVLKLILDDLQPLALLTGNPVHLLVHDFHQVSDVALCEDVLPDVGYDKALELLRVEPGGLACTPAFLEQGVTHVVGVLSALGLGCCEGLAARLALDETAEQVGTGRPAGMYALRCAGAQKLGDLPELALRDEGGERLLHAYRGSAALCIDSPDNGAGVGFVVESGVDGALEPLLAPGAGDALRVEGLGDVERALALESHVEDAFDHGVRRRVRLQLGACLDSVLHVDLPVAEWGVCAHPEATRGGLSHPPGDLLRKDISYPIKTKKSDTRGPWNFEPLDCCYELWGLHAVRTLACGPGKTELRTFRCEVSI